MLRFLFRRLLMLSITLLLTSILVFAITQFLPSDPCRVVLGREASELQITQCRADLGLDLPAIQQYLRWAGNFVRGNWGTSYSLREPVFSLVWARLINSSYIAVLTLLFMFGNAAPFPRTCIPACIQVSNGDCSA